MPATTVKFTVDVAGDDIDQLVIQATKEANEFFADLPGKFRVKDISVSYDPEYYQQRVEGAIKEAQEKFDALSDEDKEGAEVVPAAVARYQGWIEFEYELNQNPPKKTMNQVWDEQNQARDGEVVTAGNRANDPKYQDAF